MPSYIGDHTLATAWKSPGGAAEAKNSWMTKVRNFMALNSGAGEEAVGPPKKARKKSAVWCVALDHVLKNCGGEGLQKYRVALDDTLEASFRWPYLSICPDQGSDGVCSSFFYATR